jgi:arsenite-transporting ATPase
MMRRGQDALAAAAELITSLPSSAVPLRPINILGLGGLRALLAPEPAHGCGWGRDNPPAEAGAGRSGDGQEQDAPATFALPSPAGEGGDHSPDSAPGSAPAMESLGDLIASIEGSGRGVVMTMGKGGVGKTTVAAAIAVVLAQRGNRVHLSTTDPAAHVAETLAGAVDGLSVSSIDPAAETAAYREQVIREQGPKLDPGALALLEEDLRSPCTEEIAVFRAFAREVGKGSDRFVVLDTAPTGHTLLLLDASEAYQRELERQARSTQPEAVLKLLERLRDPGFTRILLVTLPEATPVHEAADLQEDLRRAGIEPFGWVVNQSLLHSGTADSVLQQREAAEIPYLHEVVNHHAKRVVCIPWQTGEPVGPDALARLAESGINRLARS